MADDIKKKFLDGVRTILRLQHEKHKQDIVDVKSEITDVIHKQDLVNLNSKNGIKSINDKLKLLSYMIWGLVIAGVTFLFNALLKLVDK